MTEASPPAGTPADACSQAGTGQGEPVSPHHRPAADGYHQLDSLAVFAGAADRVEAAAAAALTLRVTGPGRRTPRAGARQSRCCAAARALAAATGAAAGAALALHKVLPVASGIGGGSADAAAALRALDALWGTRLGTAALERIAATLGADVPVCVASRPARMEASAMP
jgi:4-diphosphocytidyl-2-C-methyl-D-erythritol kinase